MATRIYTHIDGEVCTPSMTGASVCFDCDYIDVHGADDCGEDPKENIAMSLCSDIHNGGDNIVSVILSLNDAENLINVLRQEIEKSRALV